MSSKALVGGKIYKVKFHDVICLSSILSSVWLKLLADYAGKGCQSANDYLSESEGVGPRMKTLQNMSKFLKLSAAKGFRH